MTYLLVLVVQILVGNPTCLFLRIHVPDLVFGGPLGRFAHNSSVPVDGVELGLVGSPITFSSRLCHIGRQLEVAEESKIS